MTGPSTATTVAPGADLVGPVDLDVVLVRASGSTAGTVGRGALASSAVRGRAVLLHLEEASGVTEEAARWLVDNGVAVVGTDRTELGAGGPVLATAGVPTVVAVHGPEHVPVAGARLHVVPPPGTGAGPARVYVIAGAGTGTGAETRHEEQR